MTDETGDVDLDDDDALVALLGDVLRATETEPAAVTDSAATAAFAMRRPDASLADTVFDSWLTDAGTRSDDDTRSLVFRFVDVEIELALGGPGEPTYGEVRPATARCELQLPSGTAEVPLDGAGRFDLTVEAPLLRFVITTPNGTVKTDWISR